MHAVGSGVAVVGHDFYADDGGEVGGTYVGAAGEACDLLGVRIGD